MPPAPTERIRRRDLYRLLRAAVLEGVMAPGDLLPSTRQAARDYGVSRGMMEEVFAQLTDEGFLVREVGRGSYVAPAVARLKAPAVRQRSQTRSVAPSRRGKMVSLNAACREPAVHRPFNAGIADTSEFPCKLWSRVEARAARELQHDALNFADPRGLPQLRTAIARYLAQFRGIRCDPGQVVVFNSAQQALNALAVLLLDRGDAVWIEDPCYLGTRAAFGLAGANMIPVPVDDEGLNVDLAVRRSPQARLVYTTPSHQYPAGVTLSLHRRLALIEWAARNRAWVIEDDYDGEFRAQPLTPLYSLDAHQRVIYVGTLNKSMFVSLRLAYAVLSEELVEPMANIRTQLDGFAPALPQMAMSLFMDEGHFSSHLRRMRTIYAAKHQALVEGLAPLAALGWTWPDNAAGMHLLLRHPKTELVRRVRESSGLDLALLSSYRAKEASGDGLFLRFGALDEQTIRQGAEALVEAAR